MATVIKRKRLLTVYGYIRMYIQRSFLLSYEIPDGVKNVCYDFYGQTIESVIANDEKEVKVAENEEDGTVNIRLIQDGYAWCKAWGQTIIDLAKDATWEWEFKLNEAEHACVCIGIGREPHDEIFYIRNHGYIRDFQGDNGDEDGEEKEYCPSFHDGDTIKMKLCLFDNGRSYIQFNLNGKDYAKIFDTFERDKNLDILGVQLFVELLTEGDNVTLVSFGTV